MTLKTSLVLAGDSSGAEAALANAERAMAGAAKEAQQLKSSFESVDASVARLASAQGVAAAETARLKAALATGKISAEQYNRELLETKTALSLVSSAHAKSVADLKASQAAFDAAASGARNNVTSLRQAQAGYTNLGRQVQDVAVQLQSGTNIGTIVAQQGGQIADAVSQMGGRFAGLATFLSGPWGAAITVGVGVLINMVTALGRTDDAAEKVKLATSAVGDAQSILGRVMDLTTGKINTQSSALLGLAKAQLALAAIQAQTRAAEARRGVQAIQDRPVEVNGGLGGGFSLSRRPMDARDAISRSVLDGSLKSDVALDRLENLRRIGALTDEQFAAAATSVANLGVELENLKVFGDAKALLAGTGGRGLLKPEKTKPNRKSDGGAGARAEFAEDAASKIANIRDQFSDMPTAVEKANKAMRQLDDIASDIERRKLVDGDKLAAEIGTAKKAIEDSLNKPFNDYMEQQRASAEIDKLLLQGREDEAEALRIVLQLQAKQGPLSKQQLEAVLATVQAHRQVNMVLRDQQALIQVNLDAVYDLRGALEESFGSLASGKGFSIDNIVKSIGDSYAKIAGKRIVENLFGKALRDLEEQASGVKSVRTAGEQIEASFKKAGSAADALATAFLAAGGKISGASPVAGGSAAQSDGAATTEDIVVEGRKQTGLIERMVTELQQSGEIVRDSVTALLDPVLAELNQIFGTRFFSELSSAISGAMYGYATGGIPGGILGGLKEIKGLPESLSKGLGKALGGAQTGTVVSGIANAVGIKLSKTGSQIGGAIGSVIPGVGPVIGSIVGGILGKLFGKTKTGGVSLGLVDGKTAVTGTGGNSASYKQQLTTAGGSINNALNTIAQALGGELGNYSVAIGKRKDEFRVSASGSVAATTAKKTGADIIYKGKDEAEAIQAALRNAIADGAVQGLSAAVQRALKSSSDVDAAIKEALKVQEVEILIGGLGAQIAKQLSDFERQAAERVRIAQKYGFDLVKLEERNAKDRLKLTEKLLADQVGSLQNLIDELTSGALFEGSAVDKRNVLLGKISTAKAAADAGEEGAADKLAKLLEELNAVSKEAFGTTGGFASDRGTILDAARDTIAKANQRITDAQKASDPALAETNAALDENNGQNAQIIAILAAVQAQLGAFSTVGGGDSRALTALARNL